MSAGVYRRNTFPCLWCFPSTQVAHTRKQTLQAPVGEQDAQSNQRGERSRSNHSLLDYSQTRFWCWSTSATDKLVGVVQRRRRQPAGFLVQPVARNLISKFISFLDFIHNKVQHHTGPSVISRVKMSEADTQIIRYGYKPNEEISVLVKCNLHSCRGASVVSAVTPGCRSEPPDEHLALAAVFFCAR